MKRNLFLIVFVIRILSFGVFAQNGSISGKVTDKDTDEPLPFVNINLLQSKVSFGSTTTDIDGMYSFNSIKPGKYTIMFTTVGYITDTIKNVLVKTGKNTWITCKLTVSSQAIQEIEVYEFSTPVVQKDVIIKACYSYSSVSGVGSTKSNAGVYSQNAVFDSRNNSLGNNKNIEAGILTASELNDFGKWNLWQDIESKDLKAFQNLWQIAPVNRYSVEVISDDDKPVVDALAELRDKKGKVIWSARTDNTGKAELWCNLFGNENNKKPMLYIKYQGSEYEYGKANLFENGINVLRLPVKCNVSSVLDIAFVVDATSSMIDEIEFLQAELINIINKTKYTFDDLSINLGAVFYRSETSDYVTQKSEFSSDINQTIKFIKTHNAGDGGDEVVEKAMEVAIDSLNWSKEARSRIMFLILDQQPLTNAKAISKVQTYTKMAALKGIRIIPVVASAEETILASSLEYLMRSIALATNGTYVFLTDDSGIGDKHAKPTTDQYDVYLLNDLLIKIIYQYCFVPSCNSETRFGELSDTTYVFNLPVIKSEIIDSTRTLAEGNNNLIVHDFTEHVSDQNDTIQTSDSAQVEPPQGFSDSTASEKTGFRFYPNPAHGKVTIETEGIVKELFLTDITGKLIAKYEVGKSQKFEIKMDSFPTGIYFLKFYSNYQWFSGKIVLLK